MNANEEQNVALVADIQRGNREAEAALVERFSPGLRLLLSRIGPEFAEDLHQETFQVTLSRLRERGIDEPGKLDRFIVRTAKNLLHNARRRMARMAQSGDIQTIQTVADDRPGPMEELAKQRNIAFVRHVIHEMPKKRDRTILFRFYVDGASKEEICRELKLDSLHFNRVLHRARQRFRELVQRSGFDGDDVGT